MAVKKSKIKEAAKQSFPPVLQETAFTSETHKKGVSLTNIHGLPEFWVKIIERYTAYREPVLNRFSVTDIAASPFITQCRKRGVPYVEDVSDLLPRLMGGALASLIETYIKQEPSLMPTQFRVEEKLEMVFKIGKESVTLSGRLDILEIATNILFDTKVAKDFDYPSVKFEYEAQLNIYSLMLSRCTGHEVSALQLFQIIPDWREREFSGRTGAFKEFAKDWRGFPTTFKDKAKEIKGYGIQITPPAAPFRILNVAVWGHDKTEKYVMMRLKKHLDAQKTELIKDIPTCSKDERWATDDVYAVTDTKNNRAVNGGLCKTQADADRVLAAQGNNDRYKIVLRPGFDKRCVSMYCQYQSVCPYFRDKVLPTFEKKIAS